MYIVSILWNKKKAYKISKISDKKTYYYKLKKWNCKSHEINTEIKGIAIFKLQTIITHTPPYGILIIKPGQ